MHIRIVTRSSKLALWQAYYVSEKLEKAGATTELIAIKTKGDKILDVTIAKIGSKGVFTEELETALFTGDADIAVHSAKDLQSTLPEGFELAAITTREKVHDVLVSHAPANLEKKFVLGTSSARRVAFIKHFYPHVEVVPVRGNLQTRLKKMEDGLCDALMLAFAGVHRMGFDSLIQHTFPPEVFTPPVGQGTIGIEIHKTLDAEKSQFIRQTLNDPEISLGVSCERAFLKQLDGGCSIPSFGYASLAGDRVQLSCGLISLDGKTILRATGMANITEGEMLGMKLANEILADGGSKILQDIKSIQNE